MAVNKLTLIEQNLFISISQLLETLWNRLVTTIQIETTIIPTEHISNNNNTTYI